MHDQYRLGFYLVQRLLAQRFRIMFFAALMNFSPPLHTVFVAHSSFFCLRCPPFSALSETQEQQRRLEEAEKRYYEQTQKARDAEKKVLEARDEMTRLRREYEKRVKKTQEEMRSQHDKEIQQEKSKHQADYEKDMRALKNQVCIE